MSNNGHPSFGVPERVPRERFHMAPIIKGSIEGANKWHPCFGVPERVPLKMFQMAPIIKGSIEGAIQLAPYRQGA